jgi:nucleoside-triphosphatase THEP1
MDKLLVSEIPVVAIIRARGGGYVDEVKSRDDVELWEITLENRDIISAHVFSYVASHL